MHPRKYNDNDQEMTELDSLIEYISKRTKVAETNKESAGKGKMIATEEFWLGVICGYEVVLEAIDEIKSWK